MQRAFKAPSIKQETARGRKLPGSSDAGGWERGCGRVGGWAAQGRKSKGTDRLWLGPLEKFLAGGWEEGLGL